MRSGVNLNRLFHLTYSLLFILLLGMLNCKSASNNRLNVEKDQKHNKPNVLFLISDDMNDWIEPLGGHPDVITPNLDALSNKAVLFEQAHCSAPICNPSRASVMSGLNPSTTGCYGNRQALRMSPVGFKAVTLPRYFANHGYYAFGVGKITHGKFPDPASWNDFYPNLLSQQMNGAKAMKENMNGINHSGMDWGPLDVPDSAMKDAKITEKLIEFLEIDHDKPFFLAGGWKLPHLTWHAPRKYFDMYDPDTIAIPLVKSDDINDLPKLARKITENSYFKAVTKAGKEKEGVQAYLACISFIDVQVGKVMKALEKSQYVDNTIVVFWGDHGWHLGEKRRWSKSTLWEEATRAPLIIWVPGMEASIVTTPVSFLDIYPTLVDLAGLKANNLLDGQSLVPLMQNPDVTWERPALTTHGKGNHTLRTKKWRYTLYKDGGEELYDHTTDEMEWYNLANDPAYSDVKMQLSKWFPKSEAEEIYVLNWPLEKDIFWEATIKAAKKYHNKRIFSENWDQLWK